MSVGLIDDVVGLARRGASAVCDHAKITVAAITIAPTEKMSFRIVAILLVQDGIDDLPKHKDARLPRINQ
jgi:hypothetical protein